MKNEHFYISKKGLSVADAFLNKGFLWGESPFTTMLCRRGEIVFLEEHLLRIADTVKEVYGDSFVEDLLEKVLTALNSIRQEYKEVEYSYFRVTLFQFLDNSLEFSIWSFERMPSGSPVRLISHNYQPSHDFSATIKKSDYSYKFRQRDIAKSKSFDDCLYYDNDNRLLDTSTCNIFFVKDGEVFQSELIPGVLKGIGRLKLNKFLEFKGIPCHTKLICKNDLNIFSEVWISDAFNGLRCVETIDDKQYLKDNYNRILNEFNNFCGDIWPIKN